MLDCKLHYTGSMKSKAPNNFSLELEVYNKANYLNEKNARKLKKYYHTNYHSSNSSYSNIHIIHHYNLVVLL
jgi:hypothetical protein